VLFRKNRAATPDADLPLGLKGLSLGPSILRVPKVLRVRRISSISVIIFVFLFCWMLNFLLCYYQQISIEQGLQAFLS